MRKLYSYMALSLLALAAGCQREEIVSVEQDNDVMEVYATIEDVDDAQTRTYLSGTDVYWSSGDKIAVFYKNTLRKRFDVTPESIDSKDATFVQDEDYVQPGKNDNISHNVAYYPFCEVTCAPDGTSYTLSNLTLPSTQSYVEGSVGLGAFPMVAVTENTDDVNFCFKNICGVMQFQLKGYGFVKSVSVKGNRGEILAGPAVVSAGYGNDSSIAMSSEGTKEVILDCGESGVELNETTPVSFFIALPPVQFEGGFTITVTDTWGGSKEYSTTKKNPVGRSKGLRMPAKEYIGVRPPQEGDYIDEYGVNHGQGIEIDGVVWAPVNCGYHEADFKYGKMYQWGRKYGQGYEGELWDDEVKTDQVYSDALIPEVVKGLAYLKEYQSSDNANIYFDVPALLNPKSFPHWRSTLWNQGTEESPIKSEYDPCPEGWRVPTYSELSTIVSNRVWDMSNGRYGCYFINSNSQQLSVSKIFLPATGMIDDGFPAGRGNCGCYWLSLSSEKDLFNMLLFDSVDYTLDSWPSNKAPAAAVRCVKDDTEVIPVESISINKTELTLSVGTTETLSASFLPANANQKEVYWYSKDNWVATVDASGQIEAKGVGRVTIIAMAGMQTAECEVTVVTAINYVDEYGENHGPGIKVGETVWAPVNCGYKKDDYPYGKYYQWGRKYGLGLDRNSTRLSPVSYTISLNQEKANLFYICEAGDPFNWCSTSKPDFWNEGTEGNPVKTVYDPCPEGWRVPTNTELCALTAHYSSKTTNGEGQNGYWCTGPTEYSDDVSRVFLPLAGYIYYSGSANGQGTQDCYWSSTPRPNASYSERHSFTRTSTRDYCRGNGFSVRCVQE